MYQGRHRAVAKRYIVIVDNEIALFHMSDMCHWCSVSCEHATVFQTEMGNEVVDRLVRAIAKTGNADGCLN